MTNYVAKAEFFNGYVKVLYEGSDPVEAVDVGLAYELADSTWVEEDGVIIPETRAC